LQPSDSRSTDDASAAQRLIDRQRLVVPVESLVIGLYVVELDRPWLDTPFLLQGFLIDSDEELQALRRNCSHAYVDLDRSSPEAARALAQPAPEAAVTPTASGRRYPARADIRISAATRQRFRQFARQTAPPMAARGMLGRVANWMARPLSLVGGRHADPGTAAHARSGLLPVDLQTSVYRDARTFAAELPRARRAFEFAEAALASLLAGVRAHVRIDLGEVTTGAYALVDSIIDNPDALIWVGRLRDADFNPDNHGVKVALYLAMLGRHLGLPRRHLAELALIGMLADIGKVRVPRALLEKPGMLTAEEFEQVKEHVRLGLEIIGACEALPDSVQLGIAQHHERLDGSGYPGGLVADAISLYGRMAAIADSYAALITPRPYAEASSAQDALMNLCEWAGTSFDEPLVEQFVQAVGMFPVGSLVELGSGEVGVVVTQARDPSAQSSALVLTWPDKARLDRPLARSLPRPGRSADAHHRIVAGLPVGSFGITLHDFYATDPDLS